jgi:hypothetical protein
MCAEVQKRKHGAIDFVSVSFHRSLPPRSLMDGPLIAWSRDDVGQAPNVWRATLKVTEKCFQIK